LFESKKNNG
jgi:hypothetical protein